MEVAVNLFPRAVRAVLVVLALAGLGLAVAAPAFAHVSVSAPGATSGGSDQLITFRVPNESGTAVTTEVQVRFPANTPIASVLPKPHPGWTVTTTTAKLAKPIVTDDGDITEVVSTVSWKAVAKSDAIPVGEFDEFVVLAGQLPQAASLTFPAIQTYSDGTVVKWIEVPAPGSTGQPEHPAPKLTLTPDATASAAATASEVTTSSDAGAVVLGIAALVVALGAVGYTTVRTARRG